MLIVQFVPESPRYLILNGNEDKAKKVLALIAKVNCRPSLSGRLVAQERKEQMIEEKSRISLSDDEHVGPSNLASGNSPIATEADDSKYITQLNEVDNELTVVSSDNESDSVQLLTSVEHTHRLTFSQTYIKYFIKEKAFNYYHWFLLLFKNGWWRTTLLLWYRPASIIPA